jgi:hypothetical protein
MGLSFHYSGKFRAGASLSEMIQEVKDIVEVCKWKYTIYEEEFPGGQNPENAYNGHIYGISFTPPECETVSLCFLSNRKMSSPVLFMLYGKTNDRPEHEYLYMLSVKTQFAGVETHKFIIALFRHLQKQGYFETLEISDEGKYWETGDENLLKEIFKRYVNALDSFSFAVEHIPKQKDEAYEKYFERLMKMIRNKKDSED